MPKGKRSKGQGKQSSGSRELADLVQNHPSAARADVVTVRDDLKSGPMDFRLVQNPPRNFLRMVHWIQSTLRNTFTTSSIGAVVEANQAFSLQGNVGDYASYAQVFDQYCVHSAVVRVAMQFSSNSLTGTQGRLHTALDFDNVSNLASETAIQEFGTCQSMELTGGKAVERVIKPTMAPAVWAGGAFSGYGVARMWLNCSTPNVPHYGIRVLTANSNAPYSVDVFVTVIVGFRNNV